MRPQLLAASVALGTLAAPASAQIANSFCAQNPAACQSVAPAYVQPGGYGGGYGYNPPGVYGGYGGGYGAGYGAPGYGAPGYAGYPPPGYYGPGGVAQAQVLGAIANAPQVLPGQYGQTPFPPNQADQTNAPAPPHPENPNFSRYSAGVFGDANRPTKVVQRTARSAGIQAGYAEESRRIADYLATPAIAARLDARYGFEALMVGPDIVPPVVSELREVRRTPARTVLVTTIGSFEILRDARVAVTPPNWRDYLTVAPPPEPAPTWSPPKGAEEQANWDVGYKGGLALGIDQARDAFDDGLARLERDHSGMRRYHDLAAQGAVSLPVVQAKGTALRLGRDGRSAAIGERVVKLVVAAKFQPPAKAASAAAVGQ